MTRINSLLAPLGRVLIAALFLTAGFQKISGYEGTAGYMEAMGVPGALLPLVILLEIGGALAIMIGWQTRVAASLLAGFTLLSGVIFHADFGDQMQTIMFLKNIAIAGGFMFLIANGPGAWALDTRSAAPRPSAIPAE